MTVSGRRREAGLDSSEKILAVGKEKDLVVVAIRLSRLYARLFSRGKLAILNRKILGLALRAHGYHNYRSSEESGEAFFIEKILAPTKPKCCIDIGANRGEYSLHLLRATGSVVHALEPHPISFRGLSGIKRAFGDRLRPHKLAVGSEYGVADLYFSENKLYFAALSKEVAEIPYVSNEQRIQVPVVTLDGFCDSEGISDVDLVKIDVEGFESEVLRGATHTIASLRPAFVQLEFNWHQMFRDTSIWSLSKQLLGYRTFQLLPGGWVERDPKDPLTNIYRFSNFVFVRDDLASQLVASQRGPAFVTGRG